MPFRPPLTIQELHDIGQRNSKNADVVSLLWEIKRLHAHLLRLDQICRSIPDKGGAVGMVVRAAEREIKDEPVVVDRRREWADLNGGRVAPGDDD